MTDKEKLLAIKSEIERLSNFANGYYADRFASGYKTCCSDITSFIDSLPQEEPVSEDMEEAANNAVIALVPSFGQKYSDDSYVSSCRDCFKREELLELFKSGAQWQKEHLWKSADGEDLPKLERDVVVLVDNFGKLIPKLAKRTYHLIENFVDEDTGEIISIENTNEVGDVINWTEPAIYWLDAELPKLQEN